MAQPLPYERDYDFEGFQSTHPSTPLPGDKVNLELDQVAETTDQIRNRIARLQDDDLALKRKSVGYDQLKDELNGFGFNPPAEWATATLYAARDTVFHNSAFYRCSLAHTSGTFSTDLAAGKWELVADFTASTTAAQVAQAAAEAAQAAAESAETTATAAKASAITSAANAATSADSAALSEANAAASATAAAGSAGDADAAAGAAASSASNASNSATAAAGSATAAATSADEAAASAASIDATTLVRKTDTATTGFGFVIDEDDMASDSATKVPTQQSVKAYVDELGLPVLAPADATKQLFATTAGNGYTLLKTFVHAGLYGMIGDAIKQTVTASVTSGDTTLGATGASFASGDIGKAIVVQGAGASGGNLITTIATVTDNETVELADAASTTLSAVSAQICYGTDNSDPFQAFLNVIGPGGTGFIADGAYLTTKISTMALFAGAASNTGVRILGSHRGNTTLYTSIADDYVAEFIGPNGSWASHFVFEGIRVNAAVGRIGHGIKVCGVSHAYIGGFFDNCDVAVDLEAVLVSEVAASTYKCVIGVRGNKSGTFGGSWGASGCNDNHYTGNHNANIKFAGILDTFQGAFIERHFESCGGDDIANGGVSDTNRGGWAFVDPEGTVVVSGSSESNGTTDGANVGLGPLSVSTTAANAGITWTLKFSGYMKRTLNVFRSAIFVNQHASAGWGEVVWSGDLENIAGYTPSTSRPTISITATAANVGVTMLAGVIEGGDTEFTYYPNVRYTIVATKYVKPVTIATLPLASANAGCRLLVSDLGGGQGYVVSDGTSWKREREDGTAVTYTTDGPVALTPLTSSPILIYSATQTASRTISLSSIGAYEGCQFYVAKIGGDAQNLLVQSGGTTLKTLTAGDYAVVKYVAGAWFLMQSGSR